MDNKYDFTNPTFLEALRAEATGEELKPPFSDDELKMRIMANKCITAYYEKLKEEM